MKRSEVRNHRELGILRTSLVSLMVEKGLSISEMAACARLPLSSVTRFLSGDVQNPGIDVVISLAKGLGVSVGDLLGEPGKPGHIALTVEANDRMGLLRDIASVIAAANVNILNSTSRALDDGTARVSLTMEIVDPNDIPRVLNNIREAGTIRVISLIGSAAGTATKLQSDVDLYLSKHSRTGVTPVPTETK